MEYNTNYYTAQYGPQPPPPPHHHHMNHHHQLHLQNHHHIPINNHHQQPLAHHQQQNLQHHQHHLNLNLQQQQEPSPPPQSLLMQQPPIHYHHAHQQQQHHQQTQQQAASSPNSQMMHLCVFGENQNGNIDQQTRQVITPGASMPQTYQQHSDHHQQQHLNNYQQTAGSPLGHLQMSATATSGATAPMQQHQQPPTPSSTTTSPHSHLHQQSPHQLSGPSPLLMHQGSNPLMLTTTSNTDPTSPRQQAQLVGEAAAEQQQVNLHARHGHQHLQHHQGFMLDVGSHVNPDLAHYQHSTPRSSHQHHLQHQHHHHQQPHHLQHHPHHIQHQLQQSTATHHQLVGHQMHPNHHQRHLNHQQHSATQAMHLSSQQQQPIDSDQLTPYATSHAHPLILSANQTPSPPSLKAQDKMRTILDENKTGIEYNTMDGRQLQHETGNAGGAVNPPKSSAATVTTTSSAPPTATTTTTTTTATTATTIAINNNGTTNASSNNNSSTNYSNSTTSNGNNNSNNNNSTTGRSKRLRTSFKHNQIKEMKRWFSKNQNPDAKELKILASTTGLSKRVLQVWFQNARAKYRRNNAKAANQQLYDVNQHTSHMLHFQNQQTAATHQHHPQLPNRTAGHATGNSARTTFVPLNPGAGHHHNNQLVVTPPNIASSNLMEQSSALAPSLP